MTRSSLYFRCARPWAPARQSSLNESGDESLALRMSHMFVAERSNDRQVEANVSPHIYSCISPTCPSDTRTLRQPRRAWRMAVPSSSQFAIEPLLAPLARPSRGAGFDDSHHPRLCPLRLRSKRGQTSGHPVPTRMRPSTWHVNDARTSIGYNPRQSAGRDGCVTIGRPDRRVNPLRQEDLV